MRCVECEPDPLSPARYCECCGRELPPRQKRTGEPALVSGHAGEVSAHAGEKDPVSTHDDWAPKSPAWDLRCESCGGPSLHGGRCPECQRAADSPGPAPATASKSATTPAAVQPVEETTPSTSTSTASSDSATIRAAVQPVEEANRSTSTSTASSEDPSVLAPLANKPSPRPNVVNKYSRSPVPPRRRPYWIALAAAAAVVVASIGLGVWLRVQDATATALEEQPPTIVAEDQAKEPVTNVAEPEIRALTEVRESTTAPPKAPVPSAPKPTTPARSPRPAAARPAAKPVRVPSSSTRETPAVPAVNVEASAPAAAPPAPAVVATAPIPATPAPAVGPFFETKDVNESPRIATRVEPRVPDGLRAGPINEIVIVRALVSQNGHPSRISLLRRSKTGPELDSVVVAAVNQWTFSPARKKGEAVSCWFNFGVPVARAE